MRRQSIQLTALEPEDGYTLTNGETYSKRVYLGINDNADNWREIPDEEVPKTEEDANGEQT